MDCSTPGFLVFHYLVEFCSNSCPNKSMNLPTISSSVTSFSTCPQSFPASGTFPTSRLFVSGGQSIGASASILLKSIQDWFPSGLSGLISLLSKALSRVFSSTTIFFNLFFYWRTIALQNFVFCQTSTWISHQFSSVQSLSRVWLFVTPWITARQASLSITNSWWVHSNSRPSSQWCHPAISSSVVPFSSCPQSLPASGSFSVSQLFAWGGQSFHTHIYL